MNIFKLVGEVFIDTEKADKSLSKTDGNAVKLGKTFGNGIKSAANFATKTAAVVGGMAVSVGASMVAVAESTREYRNEMGKLETAFASQNLSADQAKSVYKGLQSVLGDTGQAVEASNFIAKLADTEEELSTWTEICTGVYGEFGASLPIEGLTESANETAKVGQVTGSLADALNWAGISEDDFNAKLEKCSSESERQDLIMNTLNDTYSESAKTFKETNKAVIEANQAQEKLTETTAKIGAIAEPVVTAFKESFVKLLESAMPTIQYIADNAMPKVIEFGEKAFGLLGDGIQKAIDIFNELKPTFQYIIDAVMPVITDLAEKGLKLLGEAIDTTVTAISDFTKYAKENKDIIVLLGVAVGTITALVTVFKIQMALAAAGTTLWGVVAGTATAATTALATVFTFLTSPISLIIIAIGALIAIGYLLYKNWDTVKAKLLEAWESMKQAFSNAKEAIVNKFNEMKEKAAEIVENIKTAISEKFEAVKTAISEKVQAAKDLVLGIFNGIKDGITNTATNIKDSVTNKFESMKTAASDKFNAIKSSASEKFNAVKDVIGTVMDAAKKTAMDNLLSMKTAFDENGGGFKGAMSAAMEGIKGYFTAGFDFINNLTGDKLDGIKLLFNDKMTQAKTAVSNIIDGIKTAFSSKIEAIESIVSEKFNTIKTTISNTIELTKSVVLDAFDTIKSGIATKIDNIKSNVSSKFGAIKTAITDKITSAKTSVLGVFDSIKSGISDKINAAKTAVSNAIESIKSLFNFSWKLPSLKMPHFKINGSFSLSPPKVPTLGVEWYKDGGIMTKPTMFGLNPLNNKAMVGGEAGHEAILPISNLTEYVEKAVRSENKNLEDKLERLTNMIDGYLSKMSVDKQVVLNSGALVGQLTNGIDRTLGYTENLRKRGV